MLVKYDVSTGAQLFDYADPVGYEEYYNIVAEGLNGSFVGCGKTKNVIFGFQGLIDVYGSGFSYINFYAFATGNNDELFSVCKTKDKGFACVGVTQGTFFTLQDVLFVKIDSVGAYGNNITSIQDNYINEMGINVFPNPSSDIFNVSLSKELKMIKPNFKIVDIEGNEISVGEINNHKTTIETQALSSGLYFLQIFDGNSLLKTSKISVIK